MIGRFVELDAEYAGEDPGTYFRDMVWVNPEQVVWVKAGRSFRDDRDATLIHMTDGTELRVRLGWRDVLGVLTGVLT